MTFRMKNVLLAVLLTGLLVTSAWPVQAQQGRRLHVIASFSILADVAQHVAGDAANVESVIRLGSDPHSFEADARDIVRLSEADVGLVVGMSFETGVMKVIEEAAGDHMLIVSACVPVLPVPEGVIHEEGDHAHEGHDESTVAPDSETAAACAADAALIAASFGLDEADLPLPGSQGALYSVDCGDIRCDPHVWTDPVNVARWTLTIQHKLASLDPANAAIYDANARAYLDELAALHAEIADQMAAVPAENRQLVTNHVVFNYFAARYGLTSVGVVLPGGSTTAEPSVQDVLALVDTIRQLGVKVIFTETMVSDDLARQIADEAGITTVPLFTGSLGEPGSEADSYTGYLRTNATRIADALTGR